MDEVIAALLRERYAGKWWLDRHEEDPLEPVNDLAGMRHRKVLEMEVIDHERRGKRSA